MVKTQKNCTYILLINSKPVIIKHCGFSFLSEQGFLGLTDFFIREK